MNAINKKINQLKKENKLGLMTHTVLGYPNMEKSLEIIQALISAGSDFLELQIPFSDPVADGATIMKACEVALENGMNTDRAFEMTESISTFCHPEVSAEGSLANARKKRPFGRDSSSRIAGLRMTTDIPIILMAYYNTVFRYGIDRFCKRANQLKVSGLIVPDVPPEEEPGEKFISTCLKYGIYPIRVVSPSSSVDRLKINARFAHGFVYCVSHFGVTGSDAEINDGFRAYINNVKQVMKLPVAVGFGIEKKEQIEKLRGIADMAIVGSTIIKGYNSGGVQEVSSFVKELKDCTIQKGEI